VWGRLLEGAGFGGSAGGSLGVGASMDDGRKDAVSCIKRQR